MFEPISLCSLISQYWAFRVIWERTGVIHMSSHVTSHEFISFSCWPAECVAVVLFTTNLSCEVFAKYKQYYHSTVLCVGDCYPIFCTIYTLRPNQNGRYFIDDIFKLIFLYENVSYSSPNSTGIDVQGSNKQYSNIDSDNVSALNRGQAIICNMITKFNNAQKYWGI